MVKQVSQGQRAGPSFQDFRASVSEDEEKSVLKRQPRVVSMWGGAAILSSYCVSSSTAMMPFVFGHLGQIGGPASLFVFLWTCNTLQKILLDISLENPQAHTMPESVRLALGAFGGKVAYLLQFLNQQINLPVYMLFLVVSMKNMLFPLGSHTPEGDVFPAWTRCNIVWLLFPLLPALWAVNTQRSFHDSGTFCMLTVVLNAIQVCLILFVVWSNRHGLENTLPRSPSHWGPELSLNNTPETHGYWVGVFSSLCLYNYVYEPCFVATEIMQEMGDKPSIKTSVDVATWSMFVLYTVVGLVPVSNWGWHRKDNVLSELGHGLPSLLANFCLLIPAAADFLVTAISLNKMALETLDPSIDIHDFRPKTRAKWFFVTLPSLLTTLLLMCFVPKLTVLAGLLTSFVIPAAQLVLPALAAVGASRKGLLGRLLTTHELLAITLGLNMGLLMIVAGGSSTVYSIVFRTSYQGDFFCELVAG